jgi:hypothetical protein
VGTGVSVLGSGAGSGNDTGSCIGTGDVGNAGSVIGSGSSESGSSANIYYYSNFLLAFYIIRYIIIRYMS